MKFAALLTLAAIALAGCESPPVTSGLEGLVTVGPNCPVQQDPPQDGCEDRPLAVTLQALRGKIVVATFTSAEDGRYNVALAPGTYEIRDKAQSLPSCHAGPVSIVPAAFTKLDIACDSGIR